MEHVGASTSRKFGFVYYIQVYCIVYRSITRNPTCLGTTTCSRSMNAIFSILRVEEDLIIVRRLERRRLILGLFSTLLERLFVKLFYEIDLKRDQFARFLKKDVPVLPLFIYMVIG